MITKIWICIVNRNSRYLLLITVVLKNEGIKKFLDKEGIKNILTKEDSLSYATMEEERSSVKMIVGHGRRNSWRSLNSQYQLTERKQWATNPVIDGVKRQRAGFISNERGVRASQTEREWKYFVIILIAVCPKD